MYHQNQKYPYTSKIAIFLCSAIFAFFLGLPAAQAFHFPWDQGHDTTDWQVPNQEGPCEGPNCDPCKNSSGSPVYLITGHFIWTETDIDMAGQPGLGLTRTYNSNDPQDSAFGNGWATSCEMGLFKTVRPTQDSQGNPTIVTEYVLRFSNGKRYTYTQQADGTIQPPAGRYEQVEPQADGSVKLLDQSGSFNLFSPNGQLTQQVDTNGNGLTYQYNSSDQIARIADTNGRFLDFVYNSQGRVKTITDHGNRNWQYAYDANGSLVSVTNPLDGVRQYEYVTYQPQGDSQTYYHLTKITDESGVVVTEIAYTGERIKSYTVASNSFSYAYNTSTKTVTKTDSLGSNWIFVYNDDGLFTRKTDPLNNVEQYQYDENGNLIQYTDQLGKIWNATYDNIGRKLSQTTPLNETRTWDYAGNNPRPRKTTSPSGRITEVSYDTLGNLTQIKDPIGAVSSMTYDPQGNLTGTQDSLGNQGTMTFNTLRLPETSTDALNRTSTFGYDTFGNINEIENAQAEKIQIEYDLLDRPIKTIDPSGKIVLYTYDNAGRLKSITDPVGNITTYEYDIYGRLGKRTAPDTQKFEYQYQQDNLISQVTRPDSTVTNFQYDAAKRLAQINVGGFVTSYIYTARGKINSATNPTGVVTLAYDDNARPIQESINGRNVDSIYNIDGERIRLAALGKIFDYTRDLSGQLIKITTDEGDYDLTYDDLGRRTKLSLPNGSTVDYGYDNASQLIFIRHSGSFNANYDFTYNAAGMITQWRGDGADWDYQYDEDSALTRATQGSIAFDYPADSAGNLLINGRLYDEANKLTEDNDYNYIYDLRGNLLKKQHKVTGVRVVYTWNSQNQLIKLERFSNATSTTPSTATEYTYGPFGRRWSRTVDGVKEFYVYDGQDRLATLDSVGTVTNSVTFGPSIDEPLGQTGNLGQRYFHADHLGSIRALSDGSGVTSSYAYTPFGGTLSVSDTDSNPFRYTAREYESDDLYYYRARYFDPTIQRFLSEDPIGFIGGDINLYRYLGNNPINYTDASGDLFWLIPIIWAGAEIGLSVYDAYDTADTILDPCKSGWEKAIAGGLFVVGVIAPGGGYSKLDDAARHIDDAARHLDDVAKRGDNFADDIIVVTPDGVALPPGPKYKIPDNYVQNPHRSGSYGEVVNGKFKERLRIDPPTPPGKKGPNYSHYHKDGKGTHYSPRPGDPDPGF